MPLSVFGVCMVKNESDILGYTLPRMAAQLDGVIVADNLSTDATPALLDALAKVHNIRILKDPDPAYTQSAKMTALAWKAFELGADWVVPFDADEVWHVPGGPPLAEHIANQDAHVVRAVLYDHVVTNQDPESPDVMERIGWHRRLPLPLPKVCCRVLPGLVIEQGNHGAHYPGPAKTIDAGIEVRHYPYRSAEQMARKARNGKAAYDAAGDRLPQSAGGHWREYGTWYERGGLAAIRDIFTTWFYSDDPASDDLIYDPCPVPLP